MTLTVNDSDTLEQDAALDRPLRRVAYEAGMLLGLEATRDEQAYHRRRLTRQQYWLHGAGTLAGLLVSLDPADSGTPDQGIPTRVLVGPGVGIDGLGRELMLHETHCLDLGEWLLAQGRTDLEAGLDGDLLRLRIRARYADCAVAAQPVLARKLNLGTDPVQPSRVADSVALTLEVEPGGGDAAGYRPWPLHEAVPDVLPDLSADETAAIDAAAAGSEAAADQLRLQVRLLHLFESGDWSPPALLDDIEDKASLPLARLTINQATDLDNLVVNPERIVVNNLIRPFVMTANQLAFLVRGEV